MPTKSQIRDAVSESILEAVAEAGELGIPNGTAYGFCSCVVSLGTWNSIINDLCRKGKIRNDHNLLTPGPMAKI